MLIYWLIIVWWPESATELLCLLCYWNMAGYSFSHYPEYLISHFNIYHRMVTGFISKVQGIKVSMSRAVLKFSDLFRSKNFCKSGNCCHHLCLKHHKGSHTGRHEWLSEQSVGCLSGSDKSFNLWLSSQAAFPLMWHHGPQWMCPWPAIQAARREAVPWSLSNDQHCGVPPWDRTFLPSHIISLCKHKCTVLIKSTYLATPHVFWISTCDPTAQSLKGGLWKCWSMKANFPLKNRVTVY